VRDARGLKQFVVIVEQLLAAADIANQQLAVNQIVDSSLTHREEPHPNRLSINTIRQFLAWRAELRAALARPARQVRSPPWR